VNTTSPRDYIHSTSFSSKLFNGPNMKQYYISLGLKDFLGTNTPAYWSLSKVMKKIKCCDYCPRDSYEQAQ
jgi:hypothetical protein